MMTVYGYGFTPPAPPPTPEPQHTNLFMLLAVAGGVWWLWSKGYVGKAVEAVKGRLAAAGGRTV